MDCEKFEPLLLDELYEELDELTSAAVKRHVSGCARCAGILNGMKATRRAATLPIMAVPIGLEERILAAAKEAQRSANVVVPFRTKASRALTVAGRWAMRPQTAMAAVFLLMMGTSAFLIRSKDYRSHSAMSVTVEGAPAPVAQAPQANEAYDTTAAASAHGPAAPMYQRPPVMATAAPAEGVVDHVTNGQGRDTDDQTVAMMEAHEEKAKDRAYAPPPSVANAAAPAGAPGAPIDSMVQTPLARSGKGGAEATDPFSLGSAALQARNYAEATRQFDIAARGGDRNAELYAAESVKQGQGCAMALGRFETLAQKEYGQWYGNEALLRAAKCQAAMGQTEAAKTRLALLEKSSSHQAQAQAALNEVNQAVAASKAGGGTGSHAAASPKKAAAPARPAPAKPSMESEKQRTQENRATAF